MKRQWKDMTKRLAGGLLALCLLAACRGKDTTTEQSMSESGAPSEAKVADSTANADATEKGIVVYAGKTIFEKSLDPVKGGMSYGYSFTNAALLKVAPDSSYVGDMATEWNISEDAKIYTFTLREGVQFSDGSEMTAEDVAFTYETVRANQAENEAIDLTRLESVETPDAKTVVFTLKEPYSPFLDVCAQLGIVPKATYDKERFDQFPIGTGPWQVVQYDPNQQIIVEPNPHYYEGVAKLPRVTFVAMDYDAALSAARSGDLDVVMVNPAVAKEEVSGMKMVPFETMDVRQISLPVGEESTENGIPVGNNVTSDPAVRKALNIGIHREQIIQNAFNGIGKPAMSFTDNLVWARTLPVADQRVDEAIKLLEDAGWKMGADGIREKDGLRCSFELYAADDRYALAAALSEDAKALGIEIVPHSSGWDEIGKHMNTQSILWGWGQFSPTVLTSLFDSSSIGTGGFDNPSGYRNPAVDAKIAEALSASSQEEAIQSWKQVQELADEDVAYLYLVNIQHCYFIDEALDLSMATQIPHPHGHGAPIICNMKDWAWK